MRKPGEPIYLRRHMVGLMLAVVAPLVLPRLYEMVMGPLEFSARMTAGLVIAAAGGIILYRLYGASARNEPGP
ncbi:MAG TPA: hypothetical protein VHF07_05270 [Nitrospiraceae bacterium]|nr:hypothetical protein [Nitrospiraceae bacterium]